MIQLWICQLFRLMPVQFHTNFYWSWYFMPGHTKWQHYHKCDQALSIFSWLPYSTIHSSVLHHWSTWGWYWWRSKTHCRLWISFFIQCIPIQYVPWNIYTALLLLFYCCSITSSYELLLFIYLYFPGLLHWHWDGHNIILQSTKMPMT